jgi:hypothetical protein
MAQHVKLTTSQLFPLFDALPHSNLSDLELKGIYMDVTAMDLLKRKLDESNIEQVQLSQDGNSSAIELSFTEFMGEWNSIN